MGPTHDDVTLAAVGTAFGMALARNLELEELACGPASARALHERDQRMADIPTGAGPRYGPRAPGGARARARARPPGGRRGRTWPVVVVDNVWILPGVPSIFRRKFDLIRELFRTAPIHARAVYSREAEGPIAGTLDDGGRLFPHRRRGSCPHLADAPDYSVKITLDGRDRAAVDAATIYLVGRLGPAVVRTE